MKQLALTITTTLITLAIILILWQLHSIVLLFLFSLIIAATLRAPIDSLIQRRWPRWAAMSFVYGMVCLGLASLVFFVSVSLGAEFEVLAKALIHQYEQGYGFVQSERFSTSAWVRRLPSTELIRDFLSGPQAAVLANYLLGFTQNFATFTGQAALAFVMSIYWTADAWHFERLWLSLVGSAQRGRMRELWHNLENTVGRYVRSEISQSILAGALLTLGFWLMGLPYPFVMASIGAFAWLIPIVGAVIAIALITLVALLNGTVIAIAATLYALIVLLVLEFVVEPRLYDRHQYGSILVIVVMMAMVDAFGLLGLLAAPPLALIVQIVLQEGITTPVPNPPLVPVSLQEIEEQLHQVQTATAAAELRTPQVINMVTRLEQLLQETKQADQFVA